MIDEIIIIERDGRCVLRGAPFRPTETKTIAINEYDKSNIQRFGGLAYFGGVEDDSNQGFADQQTATV